MFIKCKMQELGARFRNEQKNYFDGTLNRKEEMQCLGEGMCIVILFSYFFYRSYLAILFLSPLSFFYRNYRKKQLIQYKTERLEQEFKETILAVQTNMQAGYSIENAFVESYQDIIKIYGENSEMGKELQVICTGMKNGKNLETLLLDLARRCPDSEIAEFAEVYSIASKTGSRWNEVIMNTVSLIREKLEIKEEIELLIHGKKLENRVMCVIPFFILVYMDITSDGYFDILYHNMIGIFIMTICMVVYILAYVLAEKVTRVK